MSQKIFETVKMTKPGRSTFDLSHDVKMSLKFGNLYPIMCEDVMPGDKWTIGCESMIRFAPMIAPVMHRIDCTMHYFFVPKRLLWKNFFAWYKGEKDPLTNLPYVHPYFEMQHDGSNYTALMDYLGLPNPAQNAGVSVGSTKLSPMAIVAYAFVWNEYYRDQNLMDKIDFELTDGDNTALVDFDVQPRAWMHDYFTSALPFAQKGAAVEIPITGLNNVPIFINDNNPTTLTGVPTSPIIQDGLTTEPGIGPGDLYAANELVTSGSSTLNDLRIAMRVQEWLEKAARGGTRDNEWIKAQFGVTTSDARLQRPEYITGIKTPVTISEVLNTTGTEDAPQGQMAGHGISVVDGNYGSYFAEEPGYIIGVMNVQPQTAYYQGIPKHWLKINDTTENAFPVFGNLGEQEIEQQELYAYTAAAKQTFGYIPRYSEYKYANNRVAGDMRSSLNFWHMARFFSSSPSLNEEFIQCVPPTDIFAVNDGTDYLWAHVFNKVRTSRLLPFYGTPTF